LKKKTIKTQFFSLQIRNPKTLVNKHWIKKGRKEKREIRVFFLGLLRHAQLCLTEKERERGKWTESLSGNWFGI
jgi:hypothetical protein